MKKISTVFLTMLLFFTLVPSITIFAAPVDVIVTADEGWTATNPGDITYDLDTKELKNGPGGYSFTATFSSTTVKSVTLTKFGNGVTVSKVVIPSAITYNDVTYIVRKVTTPSVIEAFGNYLLCSANATSGNLNTTTSNAYVTDLIISEGITALSSQSFRKSNALKHIKFPTTLTSLDGNALMDCAAMESIIIPSTITTIGNNNFSGWKALTSIELPSSITSFGTSMFYGDTKLANIVLNFPLTSIAASMFRDCSALTSFAVPSTVTGIIGNQAFSSSNVTSLVFPAGVTGVDANGLINCKALTSLTFKGNITIGTKAFQGNTALNSITFEGKTAPTFADSVAFTGCKSGLTIYYPADGTGYEEGGTFRTTVLASMPTAVFIPLTSSQTTSSVINSVVSNGTGYTVNYGITLSPEISSSQNIIALYDGNNLVAIKSIESSATSVDITTSGTITKAKIFVWNSLTNLKPLCGSPEKSIS